MVNNIDGISGGRPNTINPNSKARPDASDADARTPASGGTDEVSLTSSAQLLKELNEAVAAAPSSNQERIDTIRQALADGLYEINSGNIADKLLSLDEQL